MTKGCARTTRRRVSDCGPAGRAPFGHAPDTRSYLRDAAEGGDLTV